MIKLPLKRLDPSVELPSYAREGDAGLDLRAAHDATLDRTTNCSGELRTFTLAELSACRTDVLGSPGSPLPTRAAARPVALATIAQVLNFARRTGAKVNL